MTDNLDLWNRHADVDPKYTKPITGKQYKGTSPSPQHVLWCLTDMFGPMGQGFGARVVAEGFQPLGEELLHWCRIEFWHTDRANTFETYGQTKAYMKTKSGFMSDEDAPKKSFTDALVKAASYVGVASNIFLGRWDDQKYVHDLTSKFAEESKQQERDPRAIADGLIATIAKAQNYSQYQQTIGGAKFDAAWKWLEEAKPPMANEVKAAVEKKRAEVDPAMQAPPENAEGGHEYA